MDEVPRQKIKTMSNSFHFMNVSYGIYITISTFTSVRPSGGGGGGGGGVPLSIFKFLQSYYKVSLMKVA